MCSSEYCRPYFGKECAELLSFSIRGLQGRAGLAASRPVAPKTQQMRQRRPRARSRGPGTPSGSHLSLQPQDPVGPHQRDEELDELVDDLLLLGVLLSQAGHLSPQGLVLTATEWVWSTGWIPAATGAEGFHTQSNPTWEGEGLWVATYRWPVPTPTRTGYVMMLGTG